MRLIEKYILPNGQYFVVAETDQGEIHRFTFVNDPSDDDISSLLPPAPRELIPTNLADRVEAIVRVADAWNNLRIAAAAAATDPDFSTQERNRLAAARDIASAKLRQLL